MTERLPSWLLDASFTSPPANEVQLVTLQPSRSSSGWPLAQDIFMHIADVSAANALELKTKVWIDGVLAFDRSGGMPYFKPGYDGPGSNFQVKASPGSGVNDVHQINIDLTSLFASKATVEVRVAARSTGAYSLDESYSFTTRDTEAPTVTGVVATEPMRVEVTFDEPVQMDDEAGGALDPANYILIGVTPPYYLPVSFTLERVENYKVELVPDQELSHGRTYKLAVDGVKDTSGNPVVPSETEFVAANLLEPGRDFDLWLKIPAKLRRRDTSLTGSSPGDTEKLLACFQDVVDLLFYDVDLARWLYDVDRAPMDSINLLLEQFGNPFKLDLTDLQKRKLLRNLIAMYRQKGTEVGIINAIYFFMGVTVTITKPLARSWRLGYDKLGFTTRLGPSDSAARFTFWVNCPVSLTTAERKTMNDVIRLMKAAHEHHLILEPTPPPPLTWRLGYHKLGIETRLGG